jgi:hypothetical protein
MFTIFGETIPDVEILVLVLLPSPSWICWNVDVIPVVDVARFNRP